MHYIKTITMALLMVGISLLAACGGSHQSTATSKEFKVGYLDLAVDGSSVYLRISHDQLQQEMLYLSSLPQGLGSNDVGLDRGQMMGLQPALVQFERVGDKVLLRQKNTYYRAISDNPAEVKAVEDAFASSVLWGFEIVEESSDGVVIDATDFVVRDSHGVSRRLESTNQGQFQLDKSRSAIYLDRTKTFPKNTELEATVTFTGEKPGNFVQQVSANPFSVSLRVHHSFVQLPEPGYKPRKFHPKSGFWSFSYQDYAKPIDESMEQHFIPRHRLEKQDPSAERSPAKEPIVYYLDPGTPEPVRTALLEGARWWNQAFESAGYEDAFQVKMLPEDADPMDVRYNVIQWVHRATRGWSYGYGISDPRTGEIIKGHVTLGSLRVRQDLMIAEGLSSPYESDFDNSKLKEMALNRIRQLSAHEVGHTLGIAHNFAASMKDRASVMDYPHPLIELKDGKVHYNNAYDLSIGDWDKRVIQYGYGDFDSDRERLAHIQESKALGFTFISDPDSRSLADMHPTSSLWDNGNDPVAELSRVIQLRKHALENFDEGAIKQGQPMSDLEEVLVPIYYYPRYQMEAAGKLLGGVEFAYDVKGEQQDKQVNPVSLQAQESALTQLLNTLDSEYLALPSEILDIIPPKAYGYQKSRESTRGFTGALLDPISMAEASAKHTLAILLNDERLSRMHLQSARDANQLAVSDVLGALEPLVTATPSSGLKGAIEKRVQIAILKQMMTLLGSTSVAPEVAAEVAFSVNGIKQKLGASKDKNAHVFWLDKLASQALGVPASQKENKSIEMPPGSPIGQ